MPHQKTERHTAISKSVARAFREGREADGDDQAAAAARDGIHKTMIGDYEAGDKDLTVARLIICGGTQAKLAVMREILASLPEGERHELVRSVAAPLCPASVATLHVLHKESGELSLALSGSLVDGVETDEGLKSIRAEAADVVQVASQIAAGAEQRLAMKAEDRRLVAGLAKSRGPLSARKTA